MKIITDNEFFKRLSSSFFLLSFVICLFFIGNKGINFLVVLLSFISFLELNSLKTHKTKLTFLIPSFYIIYFLIIETNFILLEQNLLLIFFYLFSSFIIALIFFEKSNIHFSIIGLLLNSSFYSIIYLTLVHDLEYRFFFIILILISTSDSFAYLFGKKIGKTKIFPNISPNKTLEGYIFGLLSSMIISILLLSYYELTDINKIIFAIIIILSSFVGDLYISFFKRKLKIKDTGKIIPGHGGLLDRIDSWMFSFPLALLMLKLT